MMNLSNDLNMLAANNIIGYDTYAQTMNGMGVRRGFSPYGNRNAVNCQDSFTSSSIAKPVKTGLLSAVGFAIGTSIINAFQVAKDGQTGKQTLAEAIRNSFVGKNFQTVSKNLTENVQASNVVNTTANAVKSAPKGIKNVLGKIAKGGKIATSVVGIATLATLGLRAYQAHQLRNMPLNESGQPQE